MSKEQDFETVDGDKMKSGMYLISESLLLGVYHHW